MINEILNQIKPWLTWLHAHPQWAGLATFLIAFIECLALVGLVVPGTVIMTAIGALIGSGVVSAKLIFMAAALGAKLGVILSFGIGHHYREHLREMWPFKFYPRLLQKGESFFYRHGGKGIFAGRFIGPIRPMLPIIAGMLNMPSARFLFADVISAILWAPLYMLPGILLGAASTELAPDIAMHLMLVVLLALLILWCISWLIKRLIQKFFAVLHHWLDCLWAAIKHKRFLRPLHIALQDPLHPESHAQLTLGLYWILITVLFLILSFDVIHHGYLTHWNYPLLFFMRSLDHNAARDIFLRITLSAGSAVWLMVFPLMLFWFCVMRAFRTAKHWCGLGLLSFGSVEVLKNTIHSLRPWGLQVTPAGYSFPSGHTALTAVFVGFIAILIARDSVKLYRGFSYGMAVIIVLLVAVSRCYLGAHWLTDVIGSVLLALSLLMLTALSYRRKMTPKLNPIKLLLAFLIIWGGCAGYSNFKNFATAEYDYTVTTPLKVLTFSTWWNARQTLSAAPLYRLNRLGNPTQILNLQWAGDIDSIQKFLVLEGWQVSPNTTFGALLNRLSESTKKLELPVVPQLYLDKRPALMMTKLLSADNLLILTLWDSKTRFSDTQIPLWVGNISYYHIFHTGYFHLHPAKKTVLPNKPAMELLMNDLKSLNDAYIWKTEGQITLIKQNSEEGFVNN